MNARCNPTLLAVMASYRQTNFPLELNVPPQKKDERKREVVFPSDCCHVWLSCLFSTPEHPSSNFVQKTYSYTKSEDNCARENLTKFCMQKLFLARRSIIIFNNNWILFNWIIILIYWYNNNIFTRYLYYYFCLILSIALMPWYILYIEYIIYNEIKRKIFKKWYTVFINTFILNNLYHWVLCVGTCDYGKGCAISVWH